MARSTAKTNGRSQPRGSQYASYSQPTQTQRHHHDEEREDEGEEDEPGYTEDPPAGDAQTDLARKASALVRLALFNESRRIPLRRDEINKRVLGDNMRSFYTVLEEAQKRLRSIFGMELVELMTRAELEKERNTNEEIQNDANATGLRKKAATSGSKSYVLRSTLHPSLIEAAAASIAEILDAEEDECDEDANEDEVPQTYGSILSWSTSDHLGGLGLLYVILALILVSGNTLNDLELKKHLKALRLPLTATIKCPPHATHKSTTVDSYLSTLVKQNYLDKVKVGPAGAPRATQGGGKRARGNGDNEDGGSFEWRWGSRAHAEVGEQAVARFVAEFMVERMIKAAEQDYDDDDDGGTQLSGRKKRVTRHEEQEKMLENITKDITRAAGGKLSDVR